MKAIICTAYGAPEVLKVKEIDKPKPKDNEILIRIHASPVNFGDITVRNFKSITPKNFSMPYPLYILTKLMLGSKSPKNKVLGSEFAGEVVETGKEVRQFKVGNQVFGYRGQSMGANAEFLCVSEKSCVAVKPSNISYAEAASVPYGALTAMGLLSKGNIKKGSKVLINGASGSIGSAAVQLAKYYGAEVTGVCGSRRVDLVKSFGADQVIDYTKEDFTQNRETYDLIFDILRKASFSRCKDSLTPNGRYLLASFKTKQILQMIWTSLKSIFSNDTKRVICTLANERQEDLVFIKELAEIGEIKAIVDRSFTMEEAAEAHRYYESGNRTGSVLITYGIDYKVDEAEEELKKTEPIV
jgi:NADPH:quinone reductase-like Zn-dependent oxidoreductase